MAESGDMKLKNTQLSKSDCRLSCIKKGDAVVFDARILHCGNANNSVDKARALFNFSFRNPKVTGNLGYDGSIRPGYCQAMSLADVGDALLAYENGNPGRMIVGCPGTPFVRLRPARPAFPVPHFCPGLSRYWPRRSRPVHI